MARHFVSLERLKAYEIRNNGGFSFFFQRNISDAVWHHIRSKIFAPINTAFGGIKRFQYVRQLTADRTLLQPGLHSWSTPSRLINAVSQWLNSDNIFVRDILIRKSFDLGNRVHVISISSMKNNHGNKENIAELLTVLIDVYKNINRRIVYIHSKIRKILIKKNSASRKCHISAEMKASGTET
jgi:hypothetical protein